jgi:hypothetical protein
MSDARAWLSSYSKTLPELKKEGKDIDDILRIMQENHEKAKSYAENIEKVRKFYRPLKNSMQVIDFKQNQSTSVLMHQYAVTTATSDRPILGTVGAWTCLILALYDKEKHIASLAHIDAHTDTSCLLNIFKYFTSNHTSAHLSGGSQESANLCIEVINLLNKYNIDIVNIDIGKYSVEKHASLAIDARSGKIYAPIRANQLAPSNLNMNIDLSKPSPLQACFIDKLHVKELPSSCIQKENQEAVGDFRGFKKGFLL